MKEHEPKAKHRKVPFMPSNGKPLIARKFNRNELCPCKSGKKRKNCCGVETKYYQKKDKPKSETLKK
jgi:uncharacterized protein YecA (UPF0149 family)